MGEERLQSGINSTKAILMSLMQIVREVRCFGRYTMMIIQTMTVLAYIIQPTIQLFKLLNQRPIG